MKKYEASLMWAFTSNDPRFKTYGNPALIVFDIPSVAEQIAIARAIKVNVGKYLISPPDISFVKPINEKTNDYEIIYRACDGTEYCVCGHGSITTAKALAIRNHTDDKDQVFRFHLNQRFPENRSHHVLNISVHENIYDLELFDAKIKTVAKSSQVYKIIKKYAKEIINDAIFYSEIHDYTFAFKYVNDLRNFSIPYEQLLEIRKNNSKFRLIAATAKSELSDFDYETVVTSDILPSPFYKDIACGSANREIPLLLKTLNIFPNHFKTPVATFRMFYPFEYQRDKIMGGMQDVTYYWHEGRSIISSGVRFDKQLYVCIDHNTHITFEER